MRVTNVSDPVYAPNSKGGPAADGARFPPVATWPSQGDLVREAYTERKDDDDWSQAGDLVRKVMDEDARTRLVSNVAGHLSEGVTKPVLLRAFQYWRKIDEDVAKRIEASVNKR